MFLGASCGALGASRRRLEVSWARLGGVLEASGGILDSSWRRLGAFLKLLGASWRFLEASRSVVYLRNGSKLKNAIFLMDFQ